MLGLAGVSSCVQRCMWTSDIASSYQTMSTTQPLVPAPNAATMSGHYEHTAWQSITRRSCTLNSHYDSLRERKTRRSTNTRTEGWEGDEGRWEQRHQKARQAFTKCISTSAGMLLNPETDMLLSRGRVRHCAVLFVSCGHPEQAPTSKLRAEGTRLLQNRDRRPKRPGFLPASPKRRQQEIHSKFMGNS